jgi:hypothetical protein
MQTECLCRMYSFLRCRFILTSSENFQLFCLNTVFDSKVNKPSRFRFRFLHKTVLLARELYFCYLIYSCPTSLCLLLLNLFCHVLEPHHNSITTARVETSGYTRFQKRRGTIASPPQRRIRRSLPTHLIRRYGDRLSTELSFGGTR